MKRWTWPAEAKAELKKKKVAQWRRRGIQGTVNFHMARRFLNTLSKREP